MYEEPYYYFLTTSHPLTHQLWPCVSCWFGTAIEICGSPGLSARRQLNVVFEAYGWQRCAYPDSDLCRVSSSVDEWICSNSYWTQSVMDCFSVAWRWLNRRCARMSEWVVWGSRNPLCAWVALFDTVLYSCYCTVEPQISRIREIVSRSPSTEICSWLNHSANQWLLALWPVSTIFASVAFYQTAKHVYHAFSQGTISCTNSKTLSRRFSWSPCLWHLFLFLFSQYYSIYFMKDI